MPINKINKYNQLQNKRKQKLIIKKREKQEGKNTKR